jgi:hypothetical protein
MRKHRPAYPRRQHGRVSRVNLARLMAAGVGAVVLLVSKVIGEQYGAEHEEEKIRNIYISSKKQKHE